MIDGQSGTKRDRLRQLRAFCAAARFESMTRAAESLNLSQRAVALHVRSLESELESGLFERNGPVLTLTEAGRSLQRLAEPLVEELDSLAEVFVEHRDDLASVGVEVAVAPIASVVLPRFVKRFLDAHPRVRVRVTNCPLEEGLGELARGRVDAVLGPGLANTGFSQRSVFPYDLLLAMSESHPLAGHPQVRLEEASAYPAIMPATGTYGRRFEDVLGRRLKVVARVAVESSGWTVLKSFVRNGHGISVIPSCCISEKDRMHTRELEGFSHGSRCRVFTHPVESLSQPVVDFVRTLAATPDEAAVSPGDGTRLAGS